MAKNCEKQASSWFKNWWEQIESSRLIKLVLENDILPLQQKQRSRRGNKTKGILEMTTQKIDI